MILAFFLAAGLLGDVPEEVPTIDKVTANADKHEGFFTFYWEPARGRLYIELPSTVSRDFLRLTSVAEGAGSNLLGLDRSALDSESLRIVDLTLAYPKGHSFWRFLSGNSQSVEVIAEVIHPDQIPADRAARAEWLEECWRRKDARIAEVSGRATGLR